MAFRAYSMAPTLVIKLIRHSLGFLRLWEGCCGITGACKIYRQDVTCDAQREGPHPEASQKLSLSVVRIPFANDGPPIMGRSLLEAHRECVCISPCCHQDEDGKILKFHVLARPSAAILNAPFQRGILPDDVKSSRVTPGFKKGDKCDPANYRPIAVGEPLCR